MKNYIENIGVELEGAIPWDKANYLGYEMKRKLVYPKRFKESYEYLHIQGYAKEWKYWGKRNDLESFLKIMFEDYEYYGNTSCGFHIHMSMKDKKIFRLIKDKRFWDEFKARYKRKYRNKRKFLARMNNAYCKLDYSYHGDTKGCALVYCSHTSKPTLELRIMPYQSNLREAMDSIDWAVKTVNGLSEKMLPKPLPSFPTFRK